MPSVETAIAISLAFLLGSIPTAYIIGRLRFGMDIRAVGSHNPGAANAAVQLGKAYGVLVLAIDAGKGILAIIIAERLAVPSSAIYFTALAAVLGHNFTPFLRFRGGKGAATVLGISALMLWQITAISAAVGIIALAVTRNMVWAMAAIFIILNGLTIGTGQPLGQIILCLVLSFLVAGTHFVRQRTELQAAIADRDWRRFTSTH